MSDKAVLEIWAPMQQKGEDVYSMKVKLNPATPHAYFLFDTIRAHDRVYPRKIYYNSSLSDGVLEVSITENDFAQMFLGFHSSKEVSDALLQYVDPYDGRSEQILKKFANLDDQLIYAFSDSGKHKWIRGNYSHRVFVRREHEQALLERIPRKMISSIDPDSYNWKGWERWTEHMGDPKDYFYGPPLKRGDESICLAKADIDEKPIILCLERRAPGSFQWNGLIPPYNLSEIETFPCKDLDEWKKNYGNENTEWISNLWTRDKNMISFTVKMTKEAETRLRKICEEAAEYAKRIKRY